MKKVIPFTKTITFKTMIAEVTDIEVKHNLVLQNDNEISGNILVDGRYKMTDASQIEEKFNYKLPFIINIDDKYNLDNIEITIGDFYFEIVNEEDLKINVEIDIDGLSEKKLEREELLEQDDEIITPIPVEIDETKQKLEFDSNDINPLSKLEKEIEEDFKTINSTDNNINLNKLTSNSTSVSSIFSSLASNEETFSTYYVYIVRENDTLEFIMDKYKITRDLLQNYNDLDNIKIGSKLIIPCVNND